MIKKTVPSLYRQDKMELYENYYPSNQQMLATSWLDVIYHTFL
ncbi:MAG TPA: hypothetical protein PKZ69_00415 [Candidatus Cloacimonadota bacterium]|nr:hypothetical protein [Candidatus Cloacimonadota bacterium]HPK40056.1 hypothetical protein [Candidatus Cloacimonadota bacterium]